MEKNKCTYGFWCRRCRQGFIDLTYEDKLFITSKHKHDNE